MKPLVLAALLMGALAAPGCEGGGSPTIPGIASVSARRDVEEGAAKLTTTIRLEFDRPLKLAKSETPLASHFEIRAPLLVAGGESYRRVFVTRAQFTGGSERPMELRADTLVPTGSTLRLARRAFDKGAAGEIEAPIESDLSLEAATLATMAFTFGDPASLDPGPLQSAGEADRDVARVRAQLEQHLGLRGSDAAVRGRALALFDTIPLSQAPAPKVRAALAALVGTFAEPAIGALLGGDDCGGRAVSVIAFQPPPGDPGLLARVTTSDDGARVVSIGPDLEADRFEMLMPLLLHEAIHCDDRDGSYEEVAATAFDTYFYLHLVAVDPTLAAVRGRAGRDLVVDALAMLNSGRRWPESVGVLRSSGAVQALPGSNNPAASFAEFVAAAYGDVGGNVSPDEPVAMAYVAALATMSNSPAGSPFDLRYLDELLGLGLDAGVLAGVIHALELVPAD